jgi:hypothetical protein
MQHAPTAGNFLPTYIFYIAKEIIIRGETNNPGRQEQPAATNFIY